MKKIKHLLLIIFFIPSCTDNLPEKSDIELRTLPSFSILLIDSTTNFNTKNVPEGKQTALFYFDPNCQHCKLETEVIIADIKRLKDIQFYFISDFPFHLLKNYYDHYQLNKYPNITVGQDLNSSFMNFYKPSGVPCMAIFRKDKILKKIVTGTTNINTLESELLE